MSKFKVVVKTIEIRTYLVEADDELDVEETVFETPWKCKELDYHDYEEMIECEEVEESSEVV